MALSNPLFVVLNKRMVGVELTAEENKILKNATSFEIYDCLEKFENQFEPEKSNLTKNDILVMTLILKDIKVRVDNTKNIISSESDSINSNNNHPNESFNFLEVKPSLLFRVTKENVNITLANIATFIKENIWDSFYAKLCSSDIILEAIQIKVISNSNNGTPPFTLPFSVSGNLDPEIHKTSPRSYVIKMGSRLLKTGKDDNVLKLPFFTTQLITLNRPGNETIVANLKSFLDFLKNDISIFESSDTNLLKPLKLHLVFESNRYDTILKYLPVTNLVPVGMTANAKNSATPIPLNNNNGGNNNNGNNNTNKEGNKKTP
jgi:hypothetical protein